MSYQHFFLDEQVLSSEEGSFPLRLARDDMKHARVLRLKPGEVIAVIDAESDYFLCELDSFDESGLLVHISQACDAGSRVAVTLVQGIAKGEKMELIVRHATELGVNSFVPFESARSIVKLNDKKATARTERWQTIAKSAAMQSGQPCLARVAHPHKLQEIIDSLDQYDGVLVFWEEAPHSASLRGALSHIVQSSHKPATDLRLAVVVGPEGGLTEEEVNRFTQAHSQAFLVSLGPSILRTETAGIVGPALVLYELGALGSLKESV